MAVRHGYGKIAGADALVFAYDTGDTVNSFKGRPTINYGPADLASWALESADVKRIATGNYYKGQPTYNCRTALGSSWIALNTTISGLRTAAGTGGTVTMSCMVRNSNSTAYPMYAFIGHDFGSTRTIAANSDWQKIQWTVNQSNMNNDYVEFRPYTNTDGVYLEMTMPMVEVNVTNASQFVNGTRSATQGLLDLTGNSTIDLTNVNGYNSDAQLEFDGTNDAFFINIDDWIRTVDDVTVEGVVEIPAGASIVGGPWAIMTDHAVDSEKDGFWWHMSLGGGYTYFRVEDTVYGERGITFGNPSTFSAGNTYHIATVVGNNGVYVYNNGVLVESYNPPFNWADISSSHIASLIVGRTFPGYFLNSVNHNVKLYNRALTADEVRNNYRHYKTRFNI